MGRFMAIANKKGKEDKKRSKVFTKMARKIAVAARAGGGDPEYNADLANAIDAAKAVNVPNKNIERAIKKGTGDLDGVNYETHNYEGYGPSGIAILVETLTDNKNRTVADIRHAFTKGNGNLGADGCVSYMFDHRGVILIKQDDSIDEEEMMLMAIDAGADDFAIEDGFYTIFTDLESFAATKKNLSNEGFEFELAELRYVPSNMQTLDDEEDVKNLNKIIDLLEDNDDVQNVYHNWEQE